MFWAKAKEMCKYFQWNFPNHQALQEATPQLDDPIEFPPIMETLQGWGYTASRVDIGLPPVEPTYHPWGLKNSAASIREINKSQTLTNLEKDLYYLLQIGKQDATNTWEAETSIQLDADVGAYQCHH